MKRILSAIFAASALSALADAPVVSNVSVVTDPDSPKVEVRYSLSVDAVVTVRFVAGGTDIPGEQTIWIGGDVGTKVSATTGDEHRSIYWAPDKEAWPNDVMPDLSSLTAVVTAWALDAPPDYMVADLVISNCVTFYASTNFIPGGILDDMYKTNKMVFRKIPAKEVVWRMGLSADGDSYFRPYKKAVLSEDFYLGVFEVTRAQSRCYCGRYETGKGGWTAFADYGMRGMSGLKYAQLLGNVDNAEPSETSDIGKFRTLTCLKTATLPTEAQWDYAARSTSGDQAYWGAVDTASSAKHAFTSTAGGSNNTGPQKVGQLIPNAYGLYDMYGNACEMCMDYKMSWAGDMTNISRDFYVDKETAGNGTHVMRGGSYANDIWYSRSGTFFGCGEDGAWNAGYRILVKAVVE